MYESHGKQRVFSKKALKSCFTKYYSQGRETLNKEILSQLVIFPGAAWTHWSPDLLAAVLVGGAGVLG